MSPFPLSFLGLMLASGCFAAVDLRWVPADGLTVACLVAIFATAPLQVVAGLLSLVQGDVAAGCGALLLGLSWGIEGIAASHLPGGQSAAGLGAFMIVVSLAAAVPVILGRSRPLVASVVALSGLRFAVSGIAAITDTVAWRDASGVVSLVVALVAWVAALATGARR